MMSKFRPLRPFARQAGISLVLVVLGLASAQTTTQIFTGNELDPIKTAIIALLSVGIAIVSAWLGMKAYKKYGNKAV